MGPKGKIYDVAIPSIILVNILVFSVWNFVPGWAEFITHNFVASRSAIADGRVWTLITCIFAHHDLAHLFISSVMLVVFGFVVEDLLGSKRFFEFYLLGGFIGAMNHCMIAPLLGHPNAVIYGSTPAITGIMVLGACVYSHRTVKAFGFIPVRPIWGATLFLGADCFGLIASNAYAGLPIGYGAHIAAALSSVLLYYYILRFRVWRDLKRIGDSDLMPINLLGQQGWVIPCNNAEEFESSKAFFGTTCGLRIKQESAHSDANKSQFSRSVTFKMRSGPLEVVEVSKSLQQIYRSPIPSLTVSNFAQALVTLEAKKYKMVAPLFRPKKRWAVTYFEGPNGQVYQLQGPHSE
jgi:membrane associated rhomboid family serine protease